MPVDPVALQIPEYNEVIKEPMDLGTINRKLLDRTINTPEEFARLIRIVFHNAMIFTVDAHHVVHQTAKGLLRLFDQDFKHSRGKS